MGGRKALRLADILYSCPAATEQALQLLEQAGGQAGLAAALQV